MNIKKFLITVVIIVLIVIIKSPDRISAKKGSVDITQKVAERCRRISLEVLNFVSEAIKMELQIREDIVYMEQVIYHENWHTDKAHRAAYLTGAVVNNRRMRKEKWLHSSGDGSVKDVLYAKGQYSTTHKFFTVEIPKECHDMAEDIVRNGTPDVPKDVIFQATFRQGKEYDIVNGEWFCYG